MQCLKYESLVPHYLCGNFSIFLVYLWSTAPIVFCLYAQDLALMPYSRCLYCGCHKWEWLNAYHDNLRTCRQLEDTVKDQARMIGVSCDRLRRN